MLCRRRHKLHLIRNTFRLTSRANSDAIKRDIKQIYTAPNADAALAALDELEEKWGTKYPAMQQADFQGADLRGIRFERCDLSGAQFSNAAMEGVRFPTASSSV